jgi:probable phosphoglycerate mutase
MLTPEPLPPLMEINLGGWDGLTVDEVRQRYPGSYEARGRDLARFCPQGGESFADLLHRSWPVFESIATGTAEHVAVVTHSGVNRVLLCRILGMPLENLFRFGQDYGCLNSIHHDGAGYQLDLLNCRVCRDIR